MKGVESGEEKIEENEMERRRKRLTERRGGRKMSEMEAAESGEERREKK